MFILALVVIRIAILFFFVKYFINAKDGLNRFILLLVLFFYCLFNVGGGVPRFSRHHGRSSPQKACYSNIRVIQGAVEMYNMDSSIMMENLDFNYLIEGHYLKGKPTGSEKNCKYVAEGNLTEDGYIYCEKHGDITGQKSEKEFKEETDLESSFFFKLWSLDKFFLSKLSSFEGTLLGTLASIIFALFGLSSSNIISSGGLVNIVLCSVILSMFKNDKKEEEVVFQSEDIWEEEQKDSTNPNESYGKKKI